MATNVPAARFVRPMKGQRDSPIVGINHW